MEDELWTTRDGRTMPVGKMDEDHVRAALRLLLRNRRVRRERILAATEAFRRVLDELREEDHEFDR